MCFSYFLKALIQSQKTPTELGTIIKRYGNKFQMYITYCNNKPKSEHIVTEHAQYFDLVRQKLHHRLDVSIAFNTFKVRQITLFFENALKMNY